MSDIFVSYAREDQDRVALLVQALEKMGCAIFWDRTIPPGTTWREILDTEIQACRCVLVVWTQKSVKSEWVLEEADIGKQKKILVPVLLDAIEPPLGFRGIQAAKLVPWNGNNSSANFGGLIAAIEKILGRPSTSLPDPILNPTRSWIRRFQEEISSPVTKSSAWFIRLVGTIFATIIISGAILLQFERARIYFTLGETCAIGLIVFVIVWVIALALAAILRWVKKAVGKWM